MTRVAECSCGQLRVAVEGEPVRVSVCHCLACQRRTGSAFGVQARFPAENVRIEGDPQFTPVPVGAFADPGFLAPAREVYGDRRHPWVSVSLRS